MSDRICFVYGCDVPVRCRGMCPKHYRRQLRYGTTAPRRTMMEPPEVRFWWYAELVASGCWEWTGAKQASGHGQLRVNGRNTAAHRFAYELMVGPIPEGLVIDHLCRNRGCVNPFHLEPVTNAENVRRGGNAAKTHCAQGHPYDSTNTRLTPEGHRRCRMCERSQRKKRSNVG